MVWKSISIDRPSLDECVLHINKLLQPTFSLLNRQEKSRRREAEVRQRVKMQSTREVTFYCHVIWFLSEGVEDRLIITIEEQLALQSWWSCPSMLQRNTVIGWLCPFPCMDQELSPHNTQATWLCVLVLASCSVIILTWAEYTRSRNSRWSCQCYFYTVLVWRGWKAFEYLLK